MNVINGILGLIVIPVGVGLLGTGGYGLFSIYSVLASYVAIVDFGIGKNLLRLLASEPRRARENVHLQNAFGIYLTISALLLLSLPALLVIVPAYIFPVSEAKISALRWIIAFAVLEYIIAVPTSMTQTFCIANEHFDRYSKFTFVAGLYRYALMFIGIWMFRTPEAVVGLVVARRLIDFFVARSLMGILPEEAWRPRFRLAEFKLIVGHSTALSVAQLFQSTVVAVGSFLVNRYFGLNGLGVYRAAFDIANRVWFFSNVIGLVIFPRFSRLLSRKDDKSLLFSILPLALKLSWVGYNLLCIIGILLAPVILDIMHLSQYGIIQLFILLLLGISMNAHANLSYEFLQAAGRYWSAVLLGLLSLTFMCMSFFVLFRPFGILAIGWAWIISQVFYSALSDAMTIFESNYAGRMQAKLLLFKAVILVLTLSVIGVSYKILSDNIQYVSAGIALVVFVTTFLKFRGLTIKTAHGVH